MVQRRVRKLPLLVASIAAGATFLLLAARGDAASPLTLKTITIDGAVGDWDAVLQNAFQTTHDGDGSSPAITANCALYSTDRDCPMGGGAGNDLYTFAWTYDSSYVYLYIERYGSASNGVDFFFVADTNQDRRLKGTGDVVIHARWWGSTGAVNVDAGPYQPADAVNGDSIVSATGYVDGYDLPGTSGAMSAITCGSAQGMGVATGADKGRKMELRIPWCAFGLPALQPFYWHVVSANNQNLSPASSLDNIGAPSGGLGTFVQRAVAFFPDRSGALLSPGQVVYDHTLRNDGNDADVFELTATSSQGAKIELLDGGTVIGRDDQGDGVWELPAGSKPQIVLAAGASKSLQVRITMPAGRAGQDVTRVTAVSANDPTVGATVTDTSHVGSPAFVPEVFQGWTQAGVAVGFTETLANGQVAADTFDLTPGAGCAGDELRVTADAAATQLVARDDTGDGVWDFVDPAYDANGNGLPDLGAVAGQSTKTFWFWVKPPAGAPNGTCSVRLAAASPTTGSSATATHAVTVAPAVTFGPSYTRAAGTSLPVGVGGSVFFPATIRNAESVSRAYTLSQIVTPSGSGATARVWSDPNGDGNPSDGQEITTTGTLAAFGGTQSVIVEIRAGTAAAGTALSVATTATATSGGASATQTSEAEVHYLVTYSDALLTRVASVFAPCTTVHLHASGLLPGDTSSYTLRWLDPSATVTRTVSPWATNALGAADDAWALAANAATGGWIARLVDGPGPRDEDLAFTVELSGNVSALTTDRVRYHPGDAVQVTGSFHDGGRVALEGGAFVYALDGAPLRTRTGVTVGAGETVQDPFTFTLPANVAAGVRTLSAGWWLSCGSAPFASRTATIEVVPASPVITSPATGARLATQSPVIHGTAQAGASVTVTIGGSSYAPVTVAADGTWSFTAPALADGSYTATAVQAVAGVPSDPSAAVPFQLDTTPPTVPTIAAIASPTNADPIVVTLTTDPGSSVTVYANGTAISTTPYSVSGGTWVFHLTLGDGTWSIQAAAADDLLNVSALSPARTVVIDRTPPPLPVVDPYPAPVRADPIPVAATAAAGSTVLLYVDGSVAATMTEGTPGRFTATIPLAFDGSYALTATAADPVGNVSAPSGAVTLVVDRTPPSAPVIAPVASPTNADPVYVSVAAEPGAVVTLELDGAPSGVTPSVSGGTYTFPLSVSSGAHAVVATATDSAGNTSSPSAAALFTVDRVPPAVPVIAPIASPTRAATLDAVVTIDPADVGATVALYVNDVLSAVTPTVSGTSYTFSLALPEGSAALTATAADALGNASAKSSPVTVVVDRTAPAAPVISPAPPPATNGDLVLIQGTAEVGSTVTVGVTGSGAAPPSSTVVAVDGTFSVAVSFLGFPDDLYSFGVTATDASQNPSAATTATVRVDRTRPAAPEILPIPVSASPVVIQVVAEPGATVSLAVDGAATGLSPVSVIPYPLDTTRSESSFSVGGLASGAHVALATATDAAGNVGDPSLTRDFNVDNSIPAAPTVGAPAFTNALQIPVAVTVGVGETPTLFVNGSATPIVPTGPTLAAGMDRYDYLLEIPGTPPTPLPEGTWLLTATATNLAGTPSPLSAPRSVVVDRTPPASAPTVVGLPAATSASSIGLSGATEPGATVTIVVGTLSPVVVTADGTGGWSATVPLPGGAGPTSYGVSVVATDAAGNASPAFTGSIQIDRAAPAVPAIAPIPSPTSAASVSVVVTVADAADVAKVALYANGVLTAVTPTVSGNAWTFTLDPGEGTTTFTATAEDALGNVSAPSAAVSVTVDRTPPAKPTIDAIASPTRASSLSVVVRLAAADAGATVQLLVNGIETTVAPAVSGTAYTFTFDPMPEGTTTFVATAKDALLNVSAASDPVTVVVDRTAPTPVVSAIPSPTNAQPLVVVATLASVPADLAGVAVHAKNVATGAETVSSTPASIAGGTFTFDLVLATATYDVWATASDTLGNVSPASNVVAVVYDVTPPAVPTIDPIPSPTNAATVPVVVRTDAGSLVRLFVNGTQSTVTPIASGGAYTFDVSLPEGNVGLTAMAADGLGNGSALSATTSVVVDRTAPAVPAIDPISPNPTHAATVTAIVRVAAADAGAVVKLLVNGVDLAAVDPSFTSSVSGTAYAFVFNPGEGSFSLTATAADALGNISALSGAQPVVVDRTPPNVPAVGPIATPTNAAVIGVGVTADVGSTVTLWVNGAQTSLVPAVAGATYSFAWAPAADGSYQLQATAADALGNVSALSAARTVVVDRTGPATAPTVTGLPAVTLATSVALSGTAEAGTTVTVALAGMAPVTALVAADGTWSADVPLPLADGAVAVTVTAVDAAGNASPSFAGSVTVDRTAPAAPAITEPAASGTVGPGAVTIGGTAEAGAVVTITVTGQPPVTITADGAGAFQTSVTLADGAYTVTMTATDAAGNVSSAATRSFTVATTATPAGGGGGCGCSPGGGSGPEALFFAVAGLALFRRRREV